MEAVNLESLLRQVQKNEIDRLSIKQECRKFGIDISNCSFSQEKYYLQRSILEELLKSHHNNPRKEYFYELLQTTNSELKIIDHRYRRNGYGCVFPGCFVRMKGYRKYLKHLKKVHNDDDLEKHFKKVHGDGRNAYYECYQCGKYYVN